ncbi:hypothetical protein XENTR_v10003538 [Xenopus tropicalis]|nr:hypothetical protein XENTR_v10003538 [Xenopus tropicalis]
MGTMVYLEKKGQAHNTCPTRSVKSPTQESLSLEKFHTSSKMQGQPIALKLKTLFIRKVNTLEPPSSLRESISQGDPTLDFPPPTGGHLDQSFLTDRTLPGQLKSSPPGI